MRPSIAKIGSGALLCVLLIDVGAARADEAPPAAPGTSDQSAPPLSAPGNLTKIEKPIPSPFHPRQRLTPATSVAAGAYCPNFGSTSLPYARWCAPSVRFGMDGKFADMHVALLFGDVLRYGALIGFEMGTPYFQLGNKRQRVALAIRGSFDLLIVGLGERVPGHYDDGLLAFSNTYGPHLSIALNPRAALEIRGAVGWTVGGFFANHEGFDRPAYGLVIESSLGVRISP